MSDVITMTKEDWLAKGTKLFGPDMMTWRFVCPACKHIASVEDFKKYKDAGASPDSATTRCIGRFDGHMDVDMGAGQPCNYTGYGLFNLCPVKVMDGEKELRSFAFDESGTSGH
ncbi:MAG: VVA0879 family protein [Dehalococcoidales bacterium]|nr:VVA0879 family protein [Dehalococcoidales bacterium]